MMVINYGKDPEKELEKCKKSPYYFATKYLTINGEPFRTRYAEKEFNKMTKQFLKLAKS